MDGKTTPELVSEVEQALDDKGLVDVGDFAISSLPEMPSAAMQGESSGGGPYG